MVVWWLARRRGADPFVRRCTTVLCVLLALQGVVGLDQYETHLPTELVWVHVAARLRLLAGGAVDRVRRGAPPRSGCPSRAPEGAREPRGGVGTAGARLGVNLTRTAHVVLAGR